MMISQEQREGVMREPWFQILDVWENGRLSLADIAQQVAEETGVPLAEIRGGRRRHYQLRARWKLIERVRVERPDLSSSQVARFLNVDGSTVRGRWRKAA